jgi:signal transduction histidine kinase
MATDPADGLRARRLVFWHELRSPAATLQTLLEVLGDGSAGELPEAARDLVERARRQASRVTEMMACAHDVERLQAGRLTLADAPVDLQAALKAALAGVEEAAKAKQVKIELLGDAPRETRADPVQTARCLQALARAAVECAQRGSSVVAEAVRAEGGGTSVTLRIEAIASKEKLDDAFGPTGPLGLRGGTGIGLHEARLLAEAMGGRARVSIEDSRATLELWFPGQPGADSKDPHP